MDSITERAERGAALLDEKWPGWWRQIDTAQLDLGEDCDCIAGQLGRGDYLGIVQDLGLMTQAEEAAYGFDMERPRTDGDGGYGTLTAAWRDLIQRRRTAEAVPA